MARLLELLRVPPEVEAAATAEDVAAATTEAGAVPSAAGAAPGAAGGSGASRGEEGGAADEESLSNEQLQSVYHRLGSDPALLSRFDLPQPRSLVSTLHE